MACRILVPRSGIDLLSFAVACRVLTNGPPEKSLFLPFSIPFWILEGKRYAEENKDTYIQVKELSVIYIYIYKILRVSTNTKFEVLIFFLNCSIVDLQYCVSFRDRAKRLMY